MMKRVFTIAAAFVAFWCATATAELCQKCRTLSYIAPVGKCISCDGTTGSGAFKLCKKCSGNQGKCQHCLSQLATAKPRPDERGPATREVRCEFRHAQHQVPDGRLVACTPAYADDAGLEVARGRFITKGDLKRRENVCVLAAQMAQRLFPGEDPLGKPVLVKQGYYRVVGVMKRRASTTPQDHSDDVYLPITTVELRIGDIGGIGLTAKDDGKTITLAVLESLRISLEENRTTGYLWETDAIAGDALRQAGKPSYVPRQPTSIGSGGTIIFTFLAIKPGKATVKLSYRRPSEKNTPAADVFTVTANVIARPLEPSRVGQGLP